MIEAVPLHALLTDRVYSKPAHQHESFLVRNRWFFRHFICDILWRGFRRSRPVLHVQRETEGNFQEYLRWYHRILICRTSAERAVRGRHKQTNSLQGENISVSICTVRYNSMLSCCTVRPLNRQWTFARISPSLCMDPLLLNFAASEGNFPSEAFYAATVVKLPVLAYRVRPKCEHSEVHNQNAVAKMAGRCL